MARGIFDKVMDYFFMNPFVAGAHQAQELISVSLNDWFTACQVTPVEKSKKRRAS